MAPLAPVVHADFTNFDLGTGLGEARGHAQIQYGSALLLADEFHVDQNTGLVAVAGAGITTTVDAIDPIFSSTGKRCFKNSAGFSLIGKWPSPFMMVAGAPVRLAISRAASLRGAANTSLK